MQNKEVVAFIFPLHFIISRSIKFWSVLVHRLRCFEIFNYFIKIYKSRERNFILIYIHSWIECSREFMVSFFIKMKIKNNGKKNRNWLKFVWSAQSNINHIEIWVCPKNFLTHFPYFLCVVCVDSPRGASNQHEILFINIFLFL
jgi:hypothetical protein